MNDCFEIILPGKHLRMQVLIVQRLSQIKNILGTKGQKITVIDPFEMMYQLLQ